MPHILELPDLAKNHGMSDVDIRGGRVKSKLDAQRPPFPFGLTKFFTDFRKLRMLCHTLKHHGDLVFNLPLPSVLQFNI